MAAYSLSEEQKRRAIEVAKEFLSAPKVAEGKTPVELGIELDANRVRLIETQLKALLGKYLGGQLPLAEFKSSVDGINKRNEFWGFNGPKGQMFFNMVVKIANEQSDCDQELKSALAVPTSEQLASSRIKTFQTFVKRLGDDWVSAGKTRYGAPKPGSIPFFLSYFWQIQNRDIWPVYYTNAVQTLMDLNIWQPADELAADYLTFKQVFEALAQLFAETFKRPFSHYDVEHIFWFKGNNPYETPEVKPTDEKAVSAQSSSAGPISVEGDRLPESYVPPIIAILPAMAWHEETLVEAAKRSGTSLERAFEKNIDAAFTMLGYETKLLGQGQGRVPDGRALAHDENYLILWDGKIRASSYSLGTDDRTIREYITTQSRELNRFRNIYYVIVSSAFTDDYDDSIAAMKMETEVSEVILLEAKALMAIVEAKLRAPLQLTLGPDGIQQLFTRSGVLNTERVRKFLG
ncbi:MAG: hypothetical protein ABMA26_22930 [Limisphaerales bacterium]